VPFGPAAAAAANEPEAPETGAADDGDHRGGWIGEPAAWDAGPGRPTTAWDGEPGRRTTTAWDSPTGENTPRRSASLADAVAAPPPTGRPAGETTGGRPAAETTTGRSAAEAGPAEAPMRPGDVDPGQITFWDEEAVAHFRAQWHEVKADFVDDPVTALTRAHDLLTDAVNELTESLLAERDELDPTRTTASPDTESMRMAMRGYREFLERILAL
jgi:hypothetical protein